MKNSKRSTKAKVRTCLRCGCTEARACAGAGGVPCSWAGNADVCTACLTEPERHVFYSLQATLATARLAFCAARYQVHNFEKILEERRAPCSLCGRNPARGGTRRGSALCEPCFQDDDLRR